MAAHGLNDEPGALAIVGHQGALQFMGNFADDVSDEITRASGKKVDTGNVPLSRDSLLRKAD